MLRYLSGIPNGPISKLTVCSIIRAVPVRHIRVRLLHGRVDSTRSQCRPFCSVEFRDSSAIYGNRLAYFDHPAWLPKVFSF